MYFFQLLDCNQRNGEQDMYNEDVEQEGDT
jgi:hypothetical protein